MKESSCLCSRPVSAARNFSPSGRRDNVSASHSTFFSRNESQLPTKKKGTTMNPLTQFTRIRILAPLIALAFVALTAVPARATPACNFSGTQLAMGTFPEGLLDLICKDLPGWDLRFKVKGDTDVYVF